MALAGVDVAVVTVGDGVEHTEKERQRIGKRTVEVENGEPDHNCKKYDKL